MEHLIKAVLQTMEDIKGVEKTMEVGEGRYSYKGTSDYEVKKTVGRAMQKNGLVLFPISINARETIDRWEEQGKTRQSITAIVNPTYRLMHQSGEHIDIEGYGHGIDSGDKAAGKATTYALKYALLYLFQVPVGAIDDADTTHSDNIAIPTNPVKNPEPNHKPYMNQKQLEEAMAYLRNGGKMEKITDKYLLSRPHEKILTGLANELSQINQSNPQNN